MASPSDWIGFESVRNVGGASCIAVIGFDTLNGLLRTLASNTGINPDV